MMTRRIAVVGVGGVGMAHVVAAGRLGYEVAVIVDRDPAVLARARQAWRNQFDEVDEFAPVQAGCRYFSNLRDQPNWPAVDVTILAVPPHTMERAAQQAAQIWREALILCEKPLWLSDELRASIGARLRLSGEYAYLRGLPDVMPCRAIGIESTRPTMTTFWGYRLFMLHDYGPHLGSILLRHLGPPRRAGWESLTNKVDRFAGRLRWDDRLIEVEATRSESVPYAWTFDGQPMHWELDLFDQQLASVECGVMPRGIEVIQHIQSAGGVRSWTSS